MTVPMKPPTKGQLAESVYIEGDLARLSEGQRVGYYLEVCNSLGLNPATKPFQYIVLNGKLTLYATRAAADQLRKVNSVSLEIMSRDVADGILTIHVRASTPDGRRDEDLGAVAFPDTLKGEARANAELKAITKAKRRATLSICGLGWLDETEIESIPTARKPPQPAPNVILPAHDPDTGEIEDAAVSAMVAEPAPVETPLSRSAGAAPLTTSGAILSWDEKLSKAALAGMDALKEQWEEVPPGAKDALRNAMNKRHAQTARVADQRRQEPTHGEDFS